MIAIEVLLVLLAAAFAQTLLPAVGWLGMAKAPLLLSAVMYYALSHGRFTLLWAAFLGGIMQDSLGFVPLGCSAACFSLAGLAVHALRDLLFKDSMLTGMGVTAVCAAGITLATWLFLALGEFTAMPDFGAPGWAVWLKAGGAALLALAAVPPVFGLARGLDRLLGTQEVAPV